MLRKAVKYRDINPPTTESTTRRTTMLGRSLLEKKLSLQQHLCLGNNPNNNAAYGTIPTAKREKEDTTKCQEYEPMSYLLGIIPPLGEH
jgi:hypothetical protein